MTPEDIQAMIDSYLQAEKDVLAGKNVTFRGKVVGMEDLDAIRAGRKEWESRQQTSLPGGGSYSLASWS